MEMDFDEIDEETVIAVDTGVSTVTEGVGDYTTTEEQLEEITVYVEEMTNVINSQHQLSSSEQAVIVSKHGRIELIPLSSPPENIEDGGGPYVEVRNQPYPSEGQEELTYGMVPLAHAEGVKPDETYSLYRLDDGNQEILDVARNVIDVGSHDWVDVSTGSAEGERQHDDGVHRFSCQDPSDMLHLKDIACEVQISADGYVQTRSPGANSEVVNEIVLLGVGEGQISVVNGGSSSPSRIMTRRSGRKSSSGKSGSVHHRDLSPTTAAASGRSSERLKTRYRNSPHKKHCSCCEHDSDSDGKSSKKRKGYKPKKLHHETTCRNNRPESLEPKVQIDDSPSHQLDTLLLPPSPPAPPDPRLRVEKKGKAKKKIKSGKRSSSPRGGDGGQTVEIFTVPENLAVGLMNSNHGEGPLIHQGKLGMAGVLPARRGRPPKFTYQIEAAMHAYNKAVNSDSDTEGAAPSNGEGEEPGDDDSIADSQSTSNKLHVCSHCGKTFNRPYKLRTHVHSHTRPRKFKCNSCNQKFFYLYDLKRHNTRVHTTAMPWVCDVCGKAFKHQQSLKAHSLRHSDEKNFHCDYCGKDFYELNSLTRHLRSHTGERPYKCTHCDKGFRQPGNLRVHMRSHTGERPFLCDVCGQGFFQRIHMKVHMRVHTGERPHVCDHCGKGFINESSLLDHLRHLRGEKPFGCHICGKMFSSSSRMHSHVRSHTGEKPFRCDTCGKMFRYASSRRRHLQVVHQGIKNYKCEFCGKEFSQSGNLRAHTRIHTGERPYRCRVCGKGFTQGTNLKKHIDLHHPGIEALLKMVTSE